MRMVIVGHRGTGKSSFLKRLKSYKIHKGPFLDLDSEIETVTGYSVHVFFEKKGESEFRKLEFEIFQKLIAFHSGFVLSVGGGFPVEKIPVDITVVWLRRDSDKTGRIFTDRPRLLPDIHPLEEYETKRVERETKFTQRANAVYTMPEGMTSESPVAAEIEKKIFSLAPYEVGGIKTLKEQDTHRSQLATPDYFELRDDLLSEEMALDFFSLFSEQKVLYSVREKNELPSWILRSRCWVDIDTEKWAELKTPPSLERVILSSHENSIDSAIEKLALIEGAGHYKLCPEIQNWEDLEQGHQWQLEDSEHRSFLPRSQNGRWAWYRLYQKGKQKINFWRDDEGSSLDQPRLFDWLSVPVDFPQFAAVLGSPVAHSYSPLFHLSLFSRQQIPFWPIEIKEDEWDKAFEVLSFLGLKAAAVTSPLKLKAYQVADVRTEISEELKSANTLILDLEKGWIAHNTDYAGFRQTLEKQAIEGPYVVWGGTGTLSMLKKIIPDLSAYSSRSGRPRSGEVTVTDPMVLIWGAPNHPDTKMPPFTWTPTWVLDLNYRENSLARYYALQAKAQYISGLDFFTCQALEQQKFWSHYL